VASSPRNDRPREQPTASFLVQPVGTELLDGARTGTARSGDSSNRGSSRSIARVVKEITGRHRVGAELTGFRRGARVHAELGSGGGVTMKKNPKAAVGDRYDVILTDGGDQKIEVARIVKEILRSGS
jgi:hypothetical protein